MAQIALNNTTAFRVNAKVGTRSEQKQPAGSLSFLSKTPFPAKATFRTKCSARTQSLSVKCGGAAPPTDSPAQDKAEERSRAMRDQSITRFAMPSKGRMAEDTLALLKDCQLPVRKPNPRQYTAIVPQLGDGVEVWFQRASDVVRRLRTGDVDMGIVGYDMFVEFGQDDPDLVVVHDELGFGHCHLALAIPQGGKYADINSLDELMAMPEWTETNPLRVVTGYHYIARKFFESKGISNVVLLHADGALEAAPLMGSADIILDLVSTGTTLRENNLKQIEGGRIMDSQGVLVARRAALQQNPAALKVTRELIERLEAHLRAQGLFTVVANMRGNSQEDVAAKLLENEELGGLQGPTVARVFTRGVDGAPHDGEFYAITICVAQQRLYDTVKSLRAIGGSGVMVSPLSYVFDEEPPRWNALLQNIGIEDYDAFIAGH